MPLAVLTARVGMENCQLLLAAGTVMSETGTVDGSVLVIVTTIPALGVRSLNVSVALIGLPPSALAEPVSNPDNRAPSS